MYNMHSSGILQIVCDYNIIQYIIINNNLQ